MSALTAARERLRSWVATIIHNAGDPREYDEAMLLRLLNEVVTAARTEQGPF